MNNLVKNLTISIVNYNSGDYLLRCLKSIQAVKNEAKLAIWIVDNASSDGSLERVKKHFPHLNYIENDKNLGFGAAHNLILKKAMTEYILILNPDTELHKGVISNMLKFMGKNPNIGAATCKLVLSDGSLDWAAHRGFPTPLASLLYFLGNDSWYHLKKSPLGKAHEVDGISGAFFLTRKSVLSRVGFFDESFFLYGEDLDLCFRIKQAGFKINYVPYVSIVHHKGISSGLKKHSQYLSRADQKIKLRSLDNFYNSMKIFYAKHYGKKYPFFINWLVYLGINLKWALAKRSMSV